MTSIGESRYPALIKEYPSRRSYVDLRRRQRAVGHAPLRDW